MILRLFIFFIISVIAGLLFLFVPELNLGSRVAISVWHQMQLSGNYRDGIITVLIESVLVFIALLFLIGVKPKPKSESESESKS